MPPCAYNDRPLDRVREQHTGVDDGTAVRASNVTCVWAADRKRSVRSFDFERNGQIGMRTRASHLRGDAIPIVAIPHAAFRHMAREFHWDDRLPDRRCSTPSFVGECAARICRSNADDERGVSDYAVLLSQNLTRAAKLATAPRNRPFEMVRHPFSERLRPCLTRCARCRPMAGAPAPGVGGRPRLRS